MLLSRILTVVVALAAKVTAQDDIHETTSPTPTATESLSSSSVSSTTSSSSGPATIAIAVGAKGHVFTPNEVKANVGDIIRFNFYPGGHRVARAAFQWPCIPYEYATTNKAGFYTGRFDPQVITNPPPHFDVRVNDTEPIFYYCAAPGSCIDYHMIGVINPNSTHTFEAQLEAARNAPYQLAPGEPFPTETASPRPTQSSSGYGSQSDPYSSGNESDGNSNSNSGDGGSSGGGGGGDGGSALSAGAIAGIAIGGAAVLILAGAIIYLCGRRGGLEKGFRKSMAVAAAPGVLEANYGGGPKSPGQASMSTFAAPDGRHASFFGQQSAMSHPLSPTTAQFAFAGGQGGYAAADAQGYHTPRQPSPAMPPPPAELPTQDAPNPVPSPPPGYAPPGGSWAPGVKP
ncbi:hypothetical protein N656DRAFT_769067 [Canariomyces notabilis]|uniref:Extracellular serine-rich protein n=1 Tax=Canariomyces notabilis TaxID=2074819 RepID=A0AAN6YSE8_9PEZI|nr:hypothetical protein N656DRAFT_769067 [Canariomyces arenarius]